MYAPFVDIVLALLASIQVILLYMYDRQIHSVCFPLSIVYWYYNLFTYVLISSI